MSQNPMVSPSEAERKELESVIEALGRWPRLASLMRYMGEKYFSGEVDQLHEYNIATEVLGRSKTMFDPGEDAIARVETHRLRKRLKEFYETQGREHLLQVTLPSGGYIPQFIQRPLESIDSSSLVEVDTEDSETAGDEPVEFNLFLEPSIQEPTPHPVEPQTRDRFRRGPSSRTYLWIAAVLVAAVLASYLFFRQGVFSRYQQSTHNLPPLPASVPTSVGDSSVPVRILAGYDGNPRMDSAGAAWGPDRYFVGGGTWRRNATPVARTSDPFLFDQWRTGDFSYRIPLKPGTYELHLFFVTNMRSVDNLATFSITINGQHALAGFEINSDALGDGIADERIFRDVFPDKDGFLTIAFASELGPPTLNAIEIVPSQPHRQNPIRLIMQTTPITDRKGQLWHPDNYFMNGRLSGPTRPLLDSPDPDLFAGERFGHFTYALPVDTRGRYTLVLHFVEIYFGPGAAGGGGTGNRIFRVICNGQTLLDDFDIYKEAGNFHDLVKTFRHLKPNAQGKLNLTFEPIWNNATISGIEVLDESD